MRSYCKYQKQLKKQQHPLGCTRKPKNKLNAQKLKSLSGEKYLLIALYDVAFQVYVYDPDEEKS